LCQRKPDRSRKQPHWRLHLPMVTNWRTSSSIK
jgi:hypothetical protein